MSHFFDYTYHVDSRDMDPFSQCRPSAVLGFLQEAATEAAVELHVSREELIEQHHAFWMLARIWYRLVSPIYWDDVLTIRTWHRGGRGVSMYRDFDLYRNGVWIGEAISLWVMADLDTHKPLRLSLVPEFAQSAGGELCKNVTLQKLSAPEGMALTEERRLHYSEADINGHVNNARYADFACDALHLERIGEGKFVSSLQVGYLAECRPGETILLYTGQWEGSCYVHGADREGKSRFDAALALSELPETP